MSLLTITLENNWVGIYWHQSISSWESFNNDIRIVSLLFNDRSIIKWINLYQRSWWIRTRQYDIEIFTGHTWKFFIPIPNRPSFCWPFSNADPYVSFTSAGFENFHGLALKKYCWPWFNVVPKNRAASEQ